METNSLIQNKVQTERVFIILNTNSFHMFKYNG